MIKDGQDEEEKDETMDTNENGCVAGLELSLSVCVFGCCTVAYDFIHLYYSHLSVCMWLLFTLSHFHITLCAGPQASSTFACVLRLDFACPKLLLHVVLLSAI